MSLSSDDLSSDSFSLIFRWQALVHCAAELGTFLVIFFPIHSPFFSGTLSLHTSVMSAARGRPFWSAFAMATVLLAVLLSSEVCWCQETRKGKKMATSG